MTGTISSADEERGGVLGEEPCVEDEFDTTGIDTTGVVRMDD